MLVPAGNNIINWIARCDECSGIGPVKAGKLYREFKTDLVEHIKNKNIDALTKVVSAEAADLLCHAFEKQNVVGTLLWLDRLAIDQRIGRKIVDFYKDKAQERVGSNPYLLISFAEEWKKVDKLAQGRFAIPPDDQRRLDAAIEHVLYAAMTEGHTCLPIEKVQERLHSLLKAGSKELAKRAIEITGTST